MRHIYIYAGSHKQASDFAREKDLHPQNWTFLYKPEQLRGIKYQWVMNEISKDMDGLSDFQSQVHPQSREIRDISLSEQLSDRSWAD